MVGCRTMVERIKIMRNKRKVKQGMFYFIKQLIGDSPVYKYGVTSNPKNRFRQLKAELGDFEVLETFFVRDMFWFESRFKFYGGGGILALVGEYLEFHEGKNMITLNNVYIWIEACRLKHQYEESK